MPIRRKTPPHFTSSMNMDNIISELNRVMTEIYEDINVIENKLSLYLNMVQDSQSGTLGTLRLTKKVTEDKNEHAYQLVGKADEGYVMIADDIAVIPESEEKTAMDIGIKNIDTEKPKYARRTK
jgi:uncharacterized coiled-coil protein SlyX|tara:strand:- start:722 stop:1093 length:372 start_codon:yes stop_codon:yes gene_type:complete